MRVHLVATVIAASAISSVALAQGIPASAWPAQCQFEADRAVSRSAPRWHAVYASCMAARQAAGQARFDAMLGGINARTRYLESQTGR